MTARREISTAADTNRSFDVVEEAVDAGAVEAAATATFLSLLSVREFGPRLRILSRSLMSLRLSPDAAENMEDQPASVLSAAM